MVIGIWYYLTIDTGEFKSMNHHELSTFYDKQKDIIRLYPFSRS